METEFYVSLYITTSLNQDEALEKVKSAIGNYYDILPNTEDQFKSDIRVLVD